MGSLSEDVPWIMTQGLFHPIVRSLYIQALGSCCAVSVNWEPFPICCKTSAFTCTSVCVRRCDSLRMDKWQKMWLFLSHSLITERRQWRRICASVTLPDVTSQQTPTPVPLSPGSQGRVGSWRHLSVTTLTSQGWLFTNSAQRWQSRGEVSWPQSHSLCQRAVSFRALTIWVGAHISRLTL